MTQAGGFGAVHLTQETVVAGRFRLVQELGRGGMGSIWRAHHVGLNIPCALKFILDEAAASPEIRARFEQEAQAVARLRSPNVVQILDHGVWEDIPYIAMELLEGEDLAKRLDRCERLEPQVISAIVTQVARALSKAHAVGLVHRDLKPANIFLVRDDDGEVVKVLDFGIAKQTQALPAGTNTRTGALLGTPQYMSPEQARGTKTVDHRSDLWSLGVIAYRSITGQLPFQSETLVDLLVKIVSSPLPVPSLVASVPAGFNAWWERAMARDPADRFQSAREMADALAAIAGLRASAAPPLLGTGPPQVGVPAREASGPSSPPPPSPIATQLLPVTDKSFSLSSTQAAGAAVRSPSPLRRRALVGAFALFALAGGLTLFLMQGLISTRPAPAAVASGAALAPPSATPLAAPPQETPLAAPPQETPLAATPPDAAADERDAGEGARPPAPPSSTPARAPVRASVARPTRAVASAAAASSKPTPTEAAAPPPAPAPTPSPTDKKHEGVF
jgi:serine/threonine protein kinase